MPINEHVKTAIQEFEKSSRTVDDYITMLARVSHAAENSTMSSYTLKRSIVAALTTID